MSDRRYSVYALRNAGGKFYIGVTGNLRRRLSEHNSGHSTWTKKQGPWDLVWQKGPMGLSDARKLESWLKRQKGGLGFHAFTGL
jgi:predicted GIY-YIG superfamily endonuclease